MAKVTIYDIAKAANVSTATVSLSLSGNPRIRPETRQHILEIANELGYAPNYIAQSLTKRKSSTLGLIVPNISNPLFSQMVSGVETYANSKGYNAILGLSDSCCEKELFYLDMLQRERVDGLVVLPTFMEAVKDKLNVQKSSASLVVFCGSTGASTGMDISYAKCDNHAGAFMAIEHLIHTGKKRIGCIFPVFNEQQYASRKSGYMDALAAHDIAYDEGFIKVCSMDSNSVFHATKELIHAKKPDAVFCISDYYSISVIRAIYALGLRIPEDIAVIGYDNISISDYLPISLSTIDTHSYRIGQMAAEMLIEKIEHPDSPLRQVILKPELVIRESTSQ